LQEVLRVYTDLLPVLQDEVRQIGEDDVAALDETLKQQQVMLLKTRNFDVRVGEYLDKLGISAQTLAETILKLPEDERFRFYAFLGEFDQTMEQVCFYRDKCKEMLQAKLYRIDKQMAALVGARDVTTYDKNAGEVASPLHPKNFEKKI
jgi:hypothetical protein